MIPIDAVASRTAVQIIVAVYPVYQLIEIESIESNLFPHKDIILLNNYNIALTDKLAMKYAELGPKDYQVAL